MSCNSPFSGLDAAPLRLFRRHLRYAAAIAICAASGACRETTSTQAERPIAEVAREAGQSRLTTDAEIFASLLEQVSARRRVMVGVRSTALPPVRMTDALAEPAWEDMIMLLPAPSDTSSVERSLDVSSWQWTASDVDAVGGVLRLAGVDNVLVLTNVGIVTGDLPHSRSEMVSVLQALGQHPNVDFIEPAQSGSWQP